MRHSFLIALLTIISGYSNAQKYFQQEVNYTIAVTLDDKTHSLSATESIEYTNNSPDALPFIYMHVWPNAYKDHRSALCKQMMRDGDLSLYFADSIDRGHITALDFKVNDAAVSWDFDSTHQDIVKITLNTPLASGESVTISTPFTVKIPNGKFSRLGHVGESYMITQWYPKPAVYDKNGWNQMPYLTIGEFYSEYGSFDVSITLPKNYVLGATGDMVDGEAELAWLDKKAKVTEGIDLFPGDMSFPASEAQTKTLRFKQENVHDFAWFADKRWHVLKGSVELPHSKREVTTWAFFTNNEADLWKNSIEYINDATYYYSLWNGDYPYNHVTAVDGTISAGGGMEYPNITVIGGSGDALGLETVIMHEVGHNWFYGILGSNERNHPWMDEGLNSLNENRYLETKYPDPADQAMLPAKIGEFLDARMNHKDLYYVGYLFNARRAYDQPVELHSNEYTQVNYGAIVYGKTALVFDYLKAYLGDATFDQCMQAYFERWKYKHPQPEDLRAVFEEITHKDLSWFFDDMIQTNRTLDYKIVKAKDNHIQLKNTGDIKGPFNVAAFKGDSLVATQWYEGFEGDTEVDFPAGDYDVYRVDGIYEMPEFNRGNNSYKTSGLFKKKEPLQIKFLGSLDEMERKKLYYAPLLGWNEQNKWMAGLALYNNIAPQKKFDFVVAPMWSFHTGEYTGYANTGFNLYPRFSKVFQHVRLEAAGARFNRYFLSNSDNVVFEKFAPSLSIKFKKKELTQKHAHFVSFRSVLTNEIVSDPGYTIQNEFTNTFVGPSVETNSNMFNQFVYKFRHDRPLRPYNVSATVLQHESFVKADLALEYTVKYNEKGKQFWFRLYGGKFLQNDMDAVAFQRYRFRMDGQNGYSDYLYDEIFLDRGRSNNMLSQQFVDNEGAFKVPTILGANADWIASMNMKIDLPWRLPIALFADLGTSPLSITDAQTGLVTNDIQVLYDFGAYVSLVKNAVEVYFPFFVSSEIQNEYDVNGLNYGDRIRFIFHLNNANPFKIARNIAP
jgi:hypothetical protein